ncbi:MAG: methyltransferase domain-containing protein [Gordonia sp. (in: high G+C Gram-positive bacteria)]
MACPVCSGGLSPCDASLECTEGHVFDVARQGYVSLLTGKGTVHRSDTAAMVASRNAIFDAGLYAPIVAAVAQTCASSKVIVDAGGGPGQYLAAALDVAAEHSGTESGPIGIGLDLSKYCARSAAKRHPRAVSVVADLWAGLPLQDGVVDTVLSVFAPRNAAETARVLRPGGQWVIVTPRPAHLAEILAPMRMLAVGEAKAARIGHELAADFTSPQTTVVRAEVEFDETALLNVAAMGPAAFHRTHEELAAAAAALAAGGSVRARLDVNVTVAQRI